MSGRAEIESRMDEVCSLCRKHRVATLQVFGSAMRDDFDAEHSDFDFLVEFLPDAQKPWLGEYQDLQRDLEALFRRKVDVVSAQGIRNPYVQRTIEEDKQLLYAA